MKTAIVLSGLPRFNTYFDLTFENLLDSEFEWYIVFWKGNYKEDFKISNNWHDVETAQDARDLLEPLLPDNHKIKSLELVDRETCPPMPRDHYERSSYHPISAVWSQHVLLKKCGENLDSSGTNYDLVVRTRTDVGIDTTLHLPSVNVYLKRFPNQILIPDSHRYMNYFNPNNLPPFCDQYAIGLQETMSKYCKQVDLYEQLYDEGILYGPESMSSNAMYKLGIEWPPTGFKLLRNHEWWDNGLRVENIVYAPFGRWAETKIKRLVDKEDK